MESNRNEYRTVKIELHENDKTGYNPIKLFEVQIRQSKMEKW